MMTITKPDAQRRARAVIDLLVDRALNGRNVANPVGYRETVLAEKRTSHHQTILDLLLEQPHLDDQTIAELIEPPAPASPAMVEPPNPSAALTEWTGAELEPADGPMVEDPAQKLSAARAALRNARKPPMGLAPISTRGAVTQ